MMSTLSVVWENLWGQTNLISCCSDLCSLRIEWASEKNLRKRKNNRRGTGQIKSLIWKLLENTRQNSQPQKTCTPAWTTYKSISHVLGRKLYTECHRGPELHFHTAVSRLIRYDSFVNSGLCSNSPTRWSCDMHRKRSPKVISSGVKKLLVRRQWGPLWTLTDRWTPGPELEQPEAAILSVHMTEMHNYDLWPQN